MSEADHRRLWILAGSRPWTVTTARAHLAGGDTFWISDAVPPDMTGSAAVQARRLLGCEIDVLVFDAYAGFDPEAFGAAVGAVRGGGRVVLLTPPLARWPDFVDPEHLRIAVHPYGAADVSGRYLRRLVALVRADSALRLVTEGAALPAPEPLAPAAVSANGPCRGADQAAAVAAVCAVAHGHRHRPLVLTSDRGRGKSAALGIAAAQLMSGGALHIVVTAPRRAAVDALFDHAARLLPGARRERATLSWGGSRLEFVAPDALLLHPSPAALLLVDEAAAIPTPLLERMLAHHARIVFATTVHGYEGTGRGFAVRFHGVLARRTPGWRALRLEMPIRWAAHDPVERFVFRALLLDAAPADDAVVVAAQACVVERLDRDRLAADEATLAQLFGLLVLAHYRTSPLDLRHLLDGPNVTVWAVRCGATVVATALTVREGGFDPALARAIYEGRRRPRGHLIAQSLAVHSGFEAAPRLVGERVMRVAVHPARQRQGVGTRLLGAIADWAQDEGCDYVGASFGASAELMAFWRRLEMLPLRLGMTREAASGTHSVIVMRPLSAAGAACYGAIRRRFCGQLPTFVSEVVPDVDAELAAALLQDTPASAAECSAVLDAQDWRDVMSFAFGRRGYETCLVALRKLVTALLGDGSLAQRLPPDAYALLFDKVVRRSGWAALAAGHGLAGRAAAEAALRGALRPLLAGLQQPVVVEESARYDDGAVAL